MALAYRCWLRNKPQEITVFRYGESVTLKPGEKDFQSLYRMLRNAGKGTLSRIFDDTVIMDSYKYFHNYEHNREYFHQNGIVLIVRYDKVQTGRRWLACGDPYNEVFFVMNSEGKAVDEEGREEDTTIALYTNSEEGKRIPFFANYSPPGSMKAVAAYVMAMDFPSVTTG